MNRNTLNFLIGSAWARANSDLIGSAWARANSDLGIDTPLHPDAELQRYRAEVETERREARRARSETCFGVRARTEFKCR